MIVVGIVSFVVGVVADLGLKGAVAYFRDKAAKVKSLAEQIASPKD